MMRPAIGILVFVMLLAGVSADGVEKESPSAPVAVGLRLPRIFGDHMVLQRDKPVRVWGWADRGDTVTVEFAGQQKSTKVADDGAWQVELKPLALSATGRVLTVKSKISNLKSQITDVLVGDVWLGSGQSNMELELGGMFAGGEAASWADHPQLRLMNVPAETSDKPQDDIPGAEWKVCTPATAAAFSAVAFYFARDVHLATGIPIGMVKAARGGTYPESWQTRASLESLKSPVVKELLDDYDRQEKEWAAKGDKGFYKGGKGLEWPGGCYNHMIHPIEKFAIRGALFYQGENSAVAGGLRTRCYPLTYPAVIRNWRQLFHDPELPFCIIEMAPWGGPGPLTSKDIVDYQSPFVRDVHLQTHLNWPNTGLVVTMDVGAPNNMHPTVKEPVGQRAACWALSQVYHVDDRTWSSPLYRSMEVKGRKAVIRFHRDGLKLPLGLQNPMGKNDGFIIAGADKVWQEAQAAIVGETVEVWSDKVPEPAAVRYAWEDCQGLVNLIVNAAGLPASPFRTDNWVAKPIFDQPLLLPAEGGRRWAAAGAETVAPTGASDSWNADAPGNWTKSGNWRSRGRSPGSKTAANDKVATFSCPLTAPRAVILNNPQFIGGITFGNPSSNGYLLACGPLRLNSGGVIQTLPGNGAHIDRISAPVQIDGAGGATATFTAGATNSGSALCFTGPVTGAATSNNTTTLILNGSNATYAWPATYNNVYLIGDGSYGGKVAVVKDGPGVWVLGSSSLDCSYTGPTTIKAGTLSVGRGSNCPGISGRTVIHLGDTRGSANATLLLSMSAIPSYTNSVIVQSGNTGTASLLQVSWATLSGTVTLGTAGSKGHSLTLANTGTPDRSITLSGVIQDPPGMMPGTAGTVTIGNGTAQNDGTGVQFSGANTYSGNTYLHSGSLRLKNTLALQNSTLDTGLTAAGHPLTFEVAGTNTYNLGGLQGAKNLDLGVSTLRVGANGQSTTYSGVLSGTGGLLKDGTGTLTLSGTNRFTGPAVVSSGVLCLSVKQALAAESRLEIAAGAKVKLDFAGDCQVRELYANGARLAAGTYGAGNLPASFTGTGTISCK